jgi:hypothetical protein
MRIHILQLKAELKQLAELLRKTKLNSKHDQSSFDKKYPTRHECNSYYILIKNEEFLSTRREVYLNYSNLDKLYLEFRSKHIAYCMLRGKTLEQIEPKLRNPSLDVHAKVRKAAASIVNSVMEKTYEQSKSLEQ